eukprot:177935-Amphidinium_carterae.1
MSYLLSDVIAHNGRIHKLLRGMALLLSMPIILKEFVEIFHDCRKLCCMKSRGALLVSPWSLIPCLVIPLSLTAFPARLGVEGAMPLMLWLYLLYYLEGVTWAGSYVRVLFESLSDIVGFVALVATILIGTAHSFCVVRDTAFVTELQAAYRMGILGDFDADTVEEDPMLYA